MTADQKADFLVELARTGNHAFACAITRVTRIAAHLERESDARFEAAWRQAEQDALRSLDKHWPGRREV